MTQAELALLQECLSLTSDGLARLENVNNASIAHIASILNEIVNFGNMLIGSNSATSATQATK